MYQTKSRGKQKDILLIWTKLSERENIQLDIMAVSHLTSDNMSSQNAIK